MVFEQRGCIYCAKMHEDLLSDPEVSDFIKARGQGLHHVAFAVEDLEARLASLKEMDVGLINEEPQELHGGKFAFVHPSSFAGVMFELIEYPDGFELP